VHAAMDQLRLIRERPADAESDRACLAARPWHARRYLAVANLAVGIACAASRRLSPGLVTSAVLVRAGGRATVFVRRVGVFEQIAATIPKDTLVRLRLAALAALRDLGSMYLYALVCQAQRMVRAYGFVAGSKAVEQAKIRSSLRLPGRAVGRRQPRAGRRRSDWNIIATRPTCQSASISSTSSLHDGTWASRAGATVMSA
jgi:hypothetical protein